VNLVLSDLTALTHGPHELVPTAVQMARTADTARSASRATSAAMILRWSR
jgi:hypothetical protein